MMKGIFWSLIVIFVFVNTFLVNIVVHEWGHYLAADYYELQPEITFEFRNLSLAHFNFNSIAIANTSFIDDRNGEHVVVIALAGPFFNLFLGVLCLTICIFWKKGFVKEMLFMGFLISLASFLMNMVSFSGSDGSLIFGSG